jgi:hypothetical protein
MADIAAATNGIPTKAQLDEGWWSEWTATVVSAENTSVTGLPYYIPQDEEHTESFGWYLPTSQGSIHLSVNSEADVLSFNQHVDDWYLNYTATRHRVAAPVPTKPEDIGAQPAGNYLTQHQQLTPVYGGDGEQFSEWTCSVSSVSSVFLEAYVVKVGDRFEIRVNTVPPGDGTYSDVSDEGQTEIEFDGETDGGISFHFKATRTENPLIGYTLGDQTTKPLQPQGDYAPATNIPKTALASGVQTSLGKADTAVQPAALAGKLDSASAAPAFSESTTYAVGEYVTYNGGLYEIGRGAGRERG